MTKNRILLIITLIAMVSAFFAFDLGQYLTLEYFKSRQVAIDGYRLAHPVMTAAGFFVIYIAVTGLSLPGAALMTLVAGAIFGLTQGTLIVSFASTLGATLSGWNATIVGVAVVDVCASHNRLQHHNSRHPIESILNKHPHF